MKMIAGYCGYNTAAIGRPCQSDILVRMPVSRVRIKCLSSFTIIAIPVQKVVSKEFDNGWWVVLWCNTIMHRYDHNLEGSST